jgi:hypothetical protein
MGLPEVSFRLWRSVQTAWEKIRVLNGWKPRLKETFELRQNLFHADLEKVLARYSETFGKDSEHNVDRLLSEFCIFSNYRIDITQSFDWHTDPETGKRAPILFGKNIDYRNEELVGNCKTLWEISRHNHLVPMAAAYALTGDCRLLEKIHQQIISWIEQNPYAMGVHWCSSLEVSIRLISWCFVHGLVSLRAKNGIFSSQSFSSQIENAIYQHAYFVINYLSRYSSANNHLIGELTGVWIACNMFDMGVHGEKWRKQVKAELIKEAALQVFEDGVSKEQATYYHLWVNEYLFLVNLIGMRYENEFDREFVERVYKMGDFLADIKSPGGVVPQIGDADDGVVVCFDDYEKENPYDAFLSVIQYQKNHNALGLEKISKKAFWFSCVNESDSGGVATSVREDPAVDGLKVYPDGGYVILSEDDAHIVFDAGSLGYPSIAAHGHADALSLILALFGEWWLVDVGTYCYHTDSLWRNYFRSSSAHNSLAFNDYDHSLIGGDFLWLKHGECKLLTAERTDAGTVLIQGKSKPYYSGEYMHDRTLIVDSGNQSLTIEDSVKLASGTNVSMYFHLHPNVIPELNKATGTCRLKHKLLKQQVEFTLDQSMDWKLIKGSNEPPMGWYSEKLGAKEETSVMVGAGVFESSCTFTTGIRWTIQG